MPPRNSSDRPEPSQPADRGRGGRGGGRGAMRGHNPSTAGGRVAPTRAHHASRGAGPPRNAPTSAGSTSLSTVSPEATSTQVINDVTLPDRSMFTIGKIRPNYATAGTARRVLTNSFEMTISGGNIYHYNDITPATKGPKQNIAVIQALYRDNATIFDPKPVYDGQHGLYAARQLPLGPSDAAKFVTSLSAKYVFNVVMKQVQVIDTSILKQYVDKERAWCNEVQVAIMALDIVIRMEPNERHPYRKKAFYMPNERTYIGSGIELWRGIFQSVRPVMHRIVVNVDLATGAMFEEGPLLRLAFQCLGGEKSQLQNRNDVMARLSVTSLSSSRRNLRKLKEFLSGVRVTTQSAPDKVRAIQDIVLKTAAEYEFETREGNLQTVEQYFRSLNVHLQYPNLICIKLGKGAVIPLECCYVPRGQLISPHKIPESLKPKFLDFSTKLPVAKLDSIKKGLANIRHDESEYVKQFGLSICLDPLQVQTRVLKAPMLRYSENSRQTQILPKQGAWNMVDKRFFDAGKIERWVIVIFDERFRNEDAGKVITAFEKACENVGIQVANKGALVSRGNPQGNIGEILLQAGQNCVTQYQEPPTLIVAILPETAAGIYTAVKHFGDISVGVPTQCLSGMKCRNAKDQYWNNVMLKVNGKLGGINVVPNPADVPALIDNNQPTIVMGADVIHPAPGLTDRPSYAALVANVDKHTAKYVTTTTVQKGRVEEIEDMKEMSRHLLKVYMSYRRKVENHGIDNIAPKRLIFFRDGVSEGQFKRVLDNELVALKAACEELGINPTITYIIAAKRHHNQLFPTEADHIDKSQNCAAGTVTDREISHPLEFDFILQSHAGIKGTSRPCHYNVIYDDYGFNADSIQALSYALCHVYAPSTRAVSIPAPVYYADRVCSRAKHHYDPDAHGPYGMDGSDTNTQVSGLSGRDVTYSTEDYKRGFKGLHPHQQRTMYFL